MNLLPICLIKDTKNIKERETFCCFVWPSEPGKISVRGGREERNQNASKQQPSLFLLSLSLSLSPSFFFHSFSSLFLHMSDALSISFSLKQNSLQRHKHSEHNLWFSSIFLSSFPSFFCSSNNSSTATQTHHHTHLHTLNHTLSTDEQQRCTTTLKHMFKPQWKTQQNGENYWGTGRRGKNIINCKKIIKSS